MDNSRIEDLRRRIQKDPASIVFAQLGEEYRRAGRFREAIETCRTGLKRHPGYLSARVTLGRALLDTGNLDQAERELKEVLRLAPENLAALKGVAEALQRRGDQAGALAHYEIALALAPRDAELQQVVATLREEMQPALIQPPEPPSTPSTGVPPEGTGACPVHIGEPETHAAPGELFDPALPVLERWLDFIVADRQQRGRATASRTAE